MKEHISWFGLDSDDDTPEEVEKLEGDVKEGEKIVTEKIKRTPINKQAKALILGIIWISKELCSLL